MIDLLSRSYLLITDYDGTAARTYEGGSNILSLFEIYDQVITEMFGSEGFQRYQELGGLKHRSPTELIHLILNHHPTFLERAHRFYDYHAHMLKQNVPEGKGVALDWKSEKPEQVVTELFVRRKLEHLMNQLGARLDNGRPWPSPCDGFLPLWETIQQLNNRDNSQFHIDTALVSSGHDMFIKACFAMWGIPPPDIYITEDDVRGRKYPQELERRVKPGPLPLALAHYHWLKMHGIRSTVDGITPLAAVTKERMLYVGDSLEKDGRLALNGGVPFIFFSEGYGKDNEPPNDALMRLAWILYRNELAFTEGKPMRDIISPLTTHPEIQAIHPEEFTVPLARRL